MFELYHGLRATRSCHSSRCCQAIPTSIGRHHLCYLIHPSSLALTARWNTNVMPKAGFYTVKVGKRPGIYTTWLHFSSLILGAPLLNAVFREDCREQVDGYPCALYKKLRTIEEAEAWMKGGASQSGPVEQRAVPYPVKPRIKPANRSLDRASSSIMPQPSGHVRPSSSSPTAKLTPTVQSKSELQPTPGPSIAGSRAMARPSRSTPGSSSPAAGEDIVYTDGACSRNGQDGSVAGIGVWWGRSDSRYVLLLATVRPTHTGPGCRNLSERCPGRQTNNRAELIVCLFPRSWAFPLTHGLSRPLSVRSRLPPYLPCL
jgi:hypothetical protein